MFQIFTSKKLQSLPSVEENKQFEASLKGRALWLIMRFLDVYM